MSSWIHLPESNHNIKNSFSTDDPNDDDNDDGCDFTIYNIPFGIFSPPIIIPSQNHHHDDRNVTNFDIPRCGTRIGNTVIDLSIFEELLLFCHIPGWKYGTFRQTTLNDFLRYDPSIWIAVRKCLQEIFIDPPINPLIYSNSYYQQKSFYDIKHVQMHVSVMIGDYTDFYASIHHANHVGTMFRGPDHALPINYKYIPIGYHGRSSTIYPSRTTIHRPRGQILSSSSTIPCYDICHKLDYEMELGAILGGSTTNDYLNENPMTMTEASLCIFGYVLLNDWSARDIQQWEYIPLGPFTSKNFATTVSVWIITKMALEGGIENNIPSLSHYTCRCTNMPPRGIDPHTNDPIPFPYLQYHNDDNTDSSLSSSSIMTLYDIQLTVSLQTNDKKDNDDENLGTNSRCSATTTTMITKTNTKFLYWDTIQQLTHHTVTGCRMKVGDLLGSGTISGPSEDSNHDGPSSKGSLLELSYNGTKPIMLHNGETRSFLHDYDTIIMKGYYENHMIRIGFGTCMGTILPATPENHSTTSTPSSLPQKVVVPNKRYQNLTLYVNYEKKSLSSLSSLWSVRIVLTMKRISYEIRSMRDDMTNATTPSFVKHNPSPILQYTDTYSNEILSISQPYAMISLLDDIASDYPSVMPTSSSMHVKAVTYQIIEIIHTSMSLSEHQEEKQDHNDIIMPHIQDCLVTVENIIRPIRNANGTDNENHHPIYCLGTLIPTIVDIYVIPIFYYASKNISDLEQTCPTLYQVSLLCYQHPWFEPTHPDHT